MKIADTFLWQLRTDRCVSSLRRRFSRTLATWSLLGSLPTAGQTITAPPADQTVSEGDPVLFTVVASGPPLIRYQWRKDGVPLSYFLSASPDYTIEAAQLQDAGDYDVIVSSTASGVNVTSPKAKLTVKPGVPLSVVVVGSGAVGSTPARLSAPGPAALSTAKFAGGTTVILTATPAFGWSFDGWWLDGVRQPDSGTALSVTIDAPHAVEAVFAAGPDGARPSLIALSGEPASTTPGDGGVQFGGVSAPQIDDSGRVLFRGNLVSTDPSRVFAPYEQAGFWFTRTRVAAHADNAIVRDYYTRVWYAPDYPVHGLGMRILRLFGLSPVFTPDGDVALAESMSMGGTETRLAVLVYAPYVPFVIPPDAGTVPLDTPAPRFETLANYLQRAELGPTPTPPGTTNVWLNAGTRLVIQGYQPSPVPVAAWERVAFVGTYVSYTATGPVATNSALVSWTKNGGLILARVSMDAVGPVMRRVDALHGNGRGALAADVTYATGNDVGQPALWTDDAGLVAVVGSAAPGLPAGFPARTTIAQLGSVTLSKSGTIAFAATLSGVGLTADNNTVIYRRRRGESPVVVARSGALIATASGPAKLNLAANDAVSLTDGPGEELVIRTHLSGSSSFVLVLNDASGNHLAYADGMPLPAFGVNKNLYLRQIDGSPPGRFPHPIDAQGRVALFGIVAETPRLNPNHYSRGVWLLEPEGTLRQLLVEGESLPGFGPVDIIQEPVDNRWVNQHGEVVLAISQFSPRNRTAIVKFGTGGLRTPQVGTQADPGSGTLKLHWSASYPDATVSASPSVDSVDPGWTPVTPAIRRIGPELEVELPIDRDQLFFRLTLPLP